MPDRRTVDPEAETSRYPGNTRASSLDSSTQGRRYLGRFRIESLLGRGGMGQVFAAWDPRLDRHVAIKLVRDAEPRLLARFAREARVQASLRHPGICPVFEVGEADGAPFIVMQRLDGLPLDEATKNTPLEAKLELMRQVADAVHEAHRAGLIHRDLKPGNVIVETPAAGPPRPYVLDFGVARPLGNEFGEAMTSEGALVGTPPYMAPEQVRGDLNALDRRTDVYGLGATLYRLVAGQPPFNSAGPAVILDVLNIDPPRLPGVPGEVELMIFKCLEKEPDRRYPSAKDFAEDLRRYLDGETILARPTSRRYRFTKWVRRHRPLAAALAGLALVVISAVVWGLIASQRAQQRQQLVVSFVEQVEEMQAEARYSHMTPLHDIRPDRTLLFRRMNQVREQMTRHGDLAVGAGHYALGAGFLALEELEAARREFKEAWANGYRTPDTAAGLAQALSAIYRERLSDLDLVRDWGSRQKRQKELEQRYGEPARVYLGQRLAAPTAAGPLLAALSHYHEGRYAEAIHALDPTGALPWSYELPRLEAEIRRVWAMELNNEGEQVAAEAQLTLAMEALTEAAMVAESDPSIHRTAAQVVFQRLSYGSAEQEVSATRVEPGLAAVGRALTADPDDARAWLWKARLHRLLASSQQNRGQDPTQQLGLAAEAARRAAGDLLPAAAAWRERARAHWGLARWHQSRGQDPARHLEQAAVALANVPNGERVYYDESLTAMIRKTRADFRTRRGEDATVDYEAAISAYRTAITLHSSPFGAWVNLGASALALAESRPEEAVRWLREAVAAFEQAQELRPQHGLPGYYLGRAYLRLAQDGHAASGHLHPDLTEKAVASYQHALELVPTMFQAHVGLGEVHHLQALHTADRGGDPRAHFEGAREAYGRALALAPETEAARLNLAWTDYFDAKLRIRAGGPPGPGLRRSMTACHRVYEAVGYPEALLCLSSAHRLEAEWRLGTGDGVRARTSIRTARQWLVQLRELQPRDAEGMRSLGRLETLEAQRLRLAGEDPAGALASARRWLDQALEQASTVADFHLASARLALEEGGTACARGIEAADRALSLRPGWASAETVRRHLVGEGCSRNLHASGSTTTST